MVMSPVPVTVLWLYMMLTFGQGGQKIYGRSLYYFCNFSVHLKFFQHGNLKQGKLDKW